MRPIGVHAGDGSCKKSVSRATLDAYELQFCIRVDILMAIERSVASLYHGNVFSAILAGPQFVEIQQFCYHGYMT